MAPTRFFHKIYGNVHELPDRGPFRYERELQKFFEKYLHTLTGVEFLASEYPTGPRHRRRIDTLGIDGAGRPVVVEYKRRQDENVITQGLDYLAWLDDHQAEFRELVRNQLGDGRVTDINFGASRLLCIAEEFLHQDKSAAEAIRRPIELLRYRRYGDAYVALEWVYGGERSSKPVAPDKTTTPPEPDPPDYSIYEFWNKTNEGTRTLFHELEKLVESLGSVRTEAHKTTITFSCTLGNRSRVVAYVRMRVLDGLRVRIHGEYLSAVTTLEDDFVRPVNSGLREIAIRDREHIRRAEPPLRAAYDHLARAAVQATATPNRVVTRTEFLESCDDNGRAVYTRILDLADRQNMTARWGPKGFTMGVDVDGTRVIFCYAYSPGSAYKQSLYTALLDKRGFRKMQAPEAAEQLHEKAKRTGLFAPAGRELKCLIDRTFTDAEVDSLVTWCESVAQAIREHADAAR